MRTELMYLEHKLGLSGPARIVRATWTRSRRGLRYRGLLLQSLRGAGFKSNYIDVATGDEYWVSRPRKDGRDRLYPGVVFVDEDVREEYWTRIRGRPDLIGESRSRSEAR
jgi:hypothetical protein